MSARKKSSVLITDKIFYPFLRFYASSQLIFFNRKALKPECACLRVERPPFAKT